MHPEEDCVASEVNDDGRSYHRCDGSPRSYARSRSSIRSLTIDNFNKEKSRRVIEERSRLNKSRPERRK